MIVFFLPETKTSLIFPPSESWFETFQLQLKKLVLALFFGDLLFPSTHEEAKMAFLFNYTILL